MSENRVNGRVALVTGASKGIGREIAIQLAKEDITVIVNYNGSKKSADKVVDTITQAGGKAKAYQCNVTEEEVCNTMIHQLIEEYGHVDILVNNAGITNDNLLMKMSDEEFKSVLDTNLLGSFHTIRALSRFFLKQRSGRIINISSVSGIIGNAGQANYSASKAGVIGLTKSVARELASRGITVNAIAPGMVETDMTSVLSDNIKGQMLEQIPLRRIGNPVDVAHMVVFLASEKASYITGQVIAIDGGMTM